MEKEYKIIIYGRGGQGAKSCAQIIAESALYTGKRIQAFPEYGPERRGAPVRSFVRISNKEIRTHEPILDPDLIIVLDSGLFNNIKELKEYNSDYLINSNKEKNYFKDILKTEKNIFVIDAYPIAYKLLNINNVNTIIIGAFTKLFKIIDLDVTKKVIKNMFTKKLKEYLIEPNYKCLDEGYNFKIR